MNCQLSTVNRQLSVLLLAALLALAPRVVAAAGLPSLTRTSELAQAGSQIEVGGLTIHGGDHKFIEAPVRFALTNGILEFLVVEPGGRDYESLLSLTSKPSALQFALLLIGCEPGPIPQQAKAGQRPGDRLQLEIEWPVQGKPQRLPVEQLLLDRKTKKSPANVPWIFTGSYFVKDFNDREVFLADGEQAFVSLWWNSAIPINLGADYGNPYHGDEQGFEVNPAKLPPKDVPLKLILRKATPSKFGKDSR